MQTEGGFGFSIVGGRDHPVQPDDPGIYIAHILPNGAAQQDGKLAVGDRVRRLAMHACTLFDVLTFYIFELPNVCLYLAFLCF